MTLERLNQFKPKFYAWLLTGIAQPGSKMGITGHMVYPPSWKMGITGHTVLPPSWKNIQNTHFAISPMHSQPHP